MAENTFDKLMKLKRLDNAYEEWTDYRDRLTAYIISNTLPGSSAAIVGAGACNDLDIKKLSVHFKGLTLMDIDRTAMEQAVMRQGTDEKKIECVCTDLAGIPKELYRSLCTEVENNLKIQGAADRIFSHYMDEAYKNRNTGGILTKGFSADCIICIGVHSQLNNIFPQLAEVYGRYTELDIEKVYKRASEENEKISPELNGVLLKGAGESLILGNEEENEENKGQIEGACQAIRDMELLKGLEKSRIILRWPFLSSQKCIYRMRISTYPTSLFV